MHLPKALLKSEQWNFIDILPDTTFEDMKKKVIAMCSIEMTTFDMRLYWYIFSYNTFSVYRRAIAGKQKLLFKHLSKHLPTLSEFLNYLMNIIICYRIIYSIWL